MNKILGCYFLLLWSFFGANAQENIERSAIKLIAHRGGVVDSLTPENSLKALEKAVHQGYWMVEVDMRITKDSVLITQHDKDFKKYFNVERMVTDMTWDEIAAMQSMVGTKVQQLDDVLKFCSENGLQVMLDNKIQGFDEKLFQRVVVLLDKYHLRDKALMIGTEESTEFFTGKIRLSCTKDQILRNMKRPGYSPHHYYLFANPSKADMLWADEHQIMVVGVINEWAFKRRGMKNADVMAEAKRVADHLKSIGVKYIQLDSKFSSYFY